MDPEINHGINDLITSFGFTLITEDAVAWLEDKTPAMCSTSGPITPGCITQPGMYAPSRTWI